MKKLFLTMLLTATLLLTACATPSSPPNASNEEVSTAEQTVSESATTAETTPPFDGTFSTDAYTVTKVEDQYYLTFHEGHKASSSDMAACESASVIFESLTDMKDKLINGTLPVSDQIVMQAAFREEEQGILMCDLTQLYEPTVPGGAKLSSAVYWQGGEFLSFPFSGGYVHFLPQNSYKGLLKKEYDNAPNTTNYTITATYQGTYESTPCEWIEYTIRGNQFRTCRMEITANGRVFYVVLIYALSAETESGSEPLPFLGSVFSEMDGKYFHVSLISPSTAPTVEWLSSFGVTPYVDTSDHVAS